MNPKRLIRRAFLFVCDAILVNVAFFLAYFFKYESYAFPVFLSEYLEQAYVTTLTFLLFFFIYRLYNRVWIQAGLHEVLHGAMACLLAGGITLLYQHFFQTVSVTITLLASIFIAGFIISLRLSLRIYVRILSSWKKHNKNFERVLVIGAGEAANIAIKEIQSNMSARYTPICAIDDDPTKLGTVVAGIQVLGNRHDIERIVQEKKIDVILIAIPSLTGESRKELIQICKNTHCQVKTMPSIYEIISGEAASRKIRDVQAEELLGRTPIVLDNDKITSFIGGKTVLVTGAAGIIGRELCSLIAGYHPSLLLLLDINENNMAELQHHLQTHYSHIPVKSIITSVKDRNGLDNLFKEYHPHIVFHAAAHKHVHLLEDRPVEAIKNNVFGTLNVAEVAEQNSAEQFIFISMDKAVNPNHIIGATKRICEMLLQSMDKRSKTRFSSIRFGNILENTDSYIHLFKQQIEHCGPVTVEHKDLTRYFMTIPEVGKLILQAGSLAKGGEIFVLDMGSPVRIYDLAQDLIKLSGYEVGTDVDIEITGLPPGSEIYEEVLLDDEGVNKTEHELIFTGRSIFDNYAELIDRLDTLRIVLEKGSNGTVTDQVIQTVHDLLPNYHSIAFEETISSLAAIHRSIDREQLGKNRIYLASPHMDGIEQIYIKEAFDTNWIAPLGPNVDEFENEVQRYVDIQAAAAMITGTSAIHMALKCVGVGPNDLVFCSSLTFSASCNPIIYQGAIPVFIDSEPDSWNMSPIALEKAFLACDLNRKLPKAVIVVNLYGQSADYDAIQHLCDTYQVPIIEDAAESIGAIYKNRYTGTIGKFGIYSFNGNKIITTSGGGMLVSNDEAAIKKVKFTITQARDQARHYQHSELGYNYRMSNVLAGIGRGQLKVLKKRIAQKKAIYDYYKAAFSALPDIEMMPVAPYGEPNYWLSVITLQENSEIKPLDIMIALEKENIESRPVWKPMHLQPYFMNFGFHSHNDEGISISEDLFNRGVCLPSDTKMSEEDLERVVGIVSGLWS